MSNMKLNSLFDSDPLVSIIVPSYNPGDKMAKCVNSLKKLQDSQLGYEILFVDDCSTDATFEWLENICAEYDNWRVFSTLENSGTPSVPRNLGIMEALGKYVFFLDCDDEILTENFVNQVRFAEKRGAEVVRSPLIVEDRRGRSLMNSISDDFDNLTKDQKVRSIISKQSTTNSSLVMRNFLITNKISWPTGNHMGEDTLFLVSLLAAASNVEYFHDPTIVYHKKASSVPSTTQKYGRRELESHLNVWNTVETELSSFKISYLELRGAVAIGYAIKTLIRYGVGEIGELEFRKFSDFMNLNRKVVQNLDFSARVSPIVHSLLDNNFLEFQRQIKPRLLIAGYDLKFISSAIPVLSEYFEIQTDEWTGHEAHDVKRSRELLFWADFIFCEWMLGNAVWYSKNKLPNQVLLVRLHRFETSRNYGNELDQKSVDAFISVSVETLEDMIRTFKLDRSKCRLVPNYLDVAKYRTNSNESRIFKMALVGAIPERKGLLESLRLLRQLRLVDSRYTLTLFGKTLSELPWVANDPQERAYFNKCDRYIQDHQLEEAISHGGWVSTEDVIQNYGFVLSTSSAESFHVAPAEAFISGNQGVFLHWPGVEFIYPSKYIFSNIQEMSSYILSQTDLKTFEESSSLGREYVTENYSLHKFVERLRQLVLEV